MQWLDKNHREIMKGDILLHDSGELELVVAFDDGQGEELFIAGVQGILWRFSEFSYDTFLEDVNLREEQACLNEFIVLRRKSV